MRILALIPPTEATGNVIRDVLYGCWCRGKRIGSGTVPPLVLLSVATVLKNDGNEVRLLDCTVEPMTLSGLEAIAGDYDAIVVLSNALSFGEDNQALLRMKEANPALKTILLGAAPTFLAERCLASSAIDFVVQKEAEFVIRDLVRSLRAKDESWLTQGSLGFRHNGGVVVNPLRPFMEDMDEFPIPDRSLLPKSHLYFNPIVKKLPYTTSLTSRGCPERCNYCLAPGFSGRKMRTWSTETILDELETLTGMGYREVYYRDETWTYSKRRTEAVCRGILDRGIKVAWIANAVVGTVDRRLLALMKEAGCHLIKVGAESGVQEIMDRTQKNIRVTMTRKTFQWAHDLGIETHAHFMFGLPGETRDTIRQTTQFIKEIDPTTVDVGIYTLYPGSSHYNEMVKSHPEIAESDVYDLGNVHTSAPFNELFTEVSRADLEKSIKTVYRNFYLRPSYFYKRLKRLTNWWEVKKLVLAGTSIFDFAIRGD